MMTAVWSACISIWQDSVACEFGYYEWKFGYNLCLKLSCSIKQHVACELERVCKLYLDVVNNVWEMQVIWFAFLHQMGLSEQGRNDVDNF